MRGPRKIRLQVSFDRETYDAIKELSEAIGASMASVAGELLQDVAPSLKNIVVALRKAKRKPAEAFDDVAEILAQAQLGASQAQLDISIEKKKLRRMKVGAAKVQAYADTNGVPPSKLKR